MPVTLAVLALAFGLGIPLGLYLWQMLEVRPAWAERIFGPVERLIHKAVGVDPDAPMDARTYAVVLVASNIGLTVLLYALARLQHVLPLNPDGIGPMRWDTALHTAVSFNTNTNQQHYSGQSELSYLTQLAGIVTNMVITPAVGMAAAAAIARGLVGGKGPIGGADGPRSLGNYWDDVTRITVRLLVPLSTIWALLLASQGVPSTFLGGATATPLDATAGLASQVVPRGPVAAMIAIKQLGTNGGGWFGPNSAVPLENPTAFSNVLECAALVLIPIAVVFYVWKTAGRDLGRLTFGVNLVLSLAFVAAILGLEHAANPAFQGLAANGLNWEGKELRFGVDGSALWATLTTQTSNGSVNAMHDSLMPLSGIVPLMGMWINSVWGGDGVGFVNFLINVLITAFVAGLMVGRAPELLGRRIEAKEMKLAAITLLTPALCVLIATAAALALPAFTASSNPGSHGLTQVLYEYTSAAANNGSGFEGLGDATPWWNLTCAVVLAISRFVPIAAPLLIAGSLAGKKPAPRTSGSLPIATLAFGATTIGVMLVVQVLTFFPALVLGPIAEQAVAVPALTASR